MSIPHLFRCPISLDLFIDPVTLCTGQTYDRPCIEKWISSGNLTCPVTMLKLHDLSLVPNHTLRHLIRQWRNQSPPPPDDSDHLYLTALKQTLASQHDSLAALKQLKALSLGGEIEGLIRLGFFPLLLEVAFQAHQRMELVELALTAALNLMPYTDQGSLNVEEGKVESLLNLIDEDDEEVSEKGVKVILAMCKTGAGLEKLVQLGAVGTLVRYIMREVQVRKGRVSAVSAMEVLVEAEGGKEAVLREEEGVKALVKMVFRVESDHQGSESAVKSLMGLCSWSVKAREEAVKQGVLTQLLLLLQSQCSGRVKTNARGLMKLLRAMWAKDPVARN